MTRLALVIGGASGIGAASARKLAQDGFTVAVADLALPDAEKVAAKLAGAGHGGFVVDIASEASVAALFDAVENQFGALSVLVISSGTNGYVGGAKPSLRDTSLEAWNRVMAINATGPFLAIGEMLRRREAQPVQNSRVILIASMSSQNAAVNSPASYIASKGAVAALTKAAAGEGAQFGMTVNAVAPGAVDTPMLRAVMPVERDAAYFSTTVAGRAGSPEEIAAAVGFLASEGASYINGACIDVNGGLLMR
jgi:3-oxoacyl-[acyl-carrier protein] reductase